MFVFFFCGGRGLNLGPFIYYALSQRQLNVCINIYE